MRDCRKCIFFTNCPKYYYECDAYSPIEEDDVDQIIETGRQEFISEWYEYIKDYE